MKDAKSIDSYVGHVSHVGHIDAQTPSPVFEDIQETVLRCKDNLELRAEYLFPRERAGKRAGKGIGILISGSGNHGLDGDVSSPFLGKGYGGGRTDLSTQLAHYLKSNGVATFRYEKRGFRDPQELGSQTLIHLAEDVVSAIEKVKSDFPEEKIVIIGFSEGALLSILAAARVPVDGLYLLALPTRPVDDLLKYQFFNWPIHLIQSALDPNQMGWISQENFENLMHSGVFPLLGPDLRGMNWRQLDQDQDGIISVKNDLTPAYLSTYQGVLSLMSSPAFCGWYSSYKEIPAFPRIASVLKIPTYLYQGEQDAQVYCKWVVEDSALFPCLKGVRVFPGLGHCFSPMDGVIGEVKTAGPFDERLLAAIVEDLSSLL